MTATGRLAAFRALTLVALALCVIVVVLGAYVRLTAAGLGCPDWPTCYGHVSAGSALENREAIDAAFPGRPFHYGKALREMTHRYAASTLGLIRARSVGEAASLVARHLIDHIEYKKGVTHSHTKLSDVLTARAGVCQDLTHVALGLLRARGIPARYVSGYLHRPESGEELESHAWCEVYSAERGWVAIDATHRTLAEAGHVSVGVGRDFSDVPPNRGVYRGGGTETISAGVTIEEVKELPEGLLAPRAIHVVGLSGPRPHVEELDYQQQQQQQQQQLQHTHYL